MSTHHQTASTDIGVLSNGHPTWYFRRICGYSCLGKPITIVCCLSKSKRCFLLACHIFRKGILAYSDAAALICIVVRMCTIANSDITTALFTVAILRMSIGTNSNTMICFSLSAYASCQRIGTTSTIVIIIAFSRISRINTIEVNFCRICSILQLSHIDSICIFCTGGEVRKLTSRFNCLFLVVPLAIFIGDFPIRSTYGNSSIRGLPRCVVFVGCSMRLFQGIVTCHTGFRAGNGITAQCYTTVYGSIGIIAQDGDILVAGSQFGVS